MQRELSKSELISCFRPRDRDDVLLPPDLPFPLAFDTLFTWHSGARAYLVLADRADRPPLGIVFYRDASGPAVPAMCDWCHTTRGRGDVTLLSCRVSARRYVGVYLCRDLSCGKKSDDYPRPENFYERDSAEARLQKIVERVGTFARRHLF